MRRIIVPLKDRSYAVVIGRHLLPRMGRLLQPLRLGPKVLIVTNRQVARYFLSPVRRSLIGAGFQIHSCLLPYGDERDKSEKTLFNLWKKMVSLGLDRSSTILALGGGVVGDLAGFAASTYMRGISFVQVPTTLLAQVDAAIGGKTAIDLPSAKNIVGTFYQPRFVAIDLETLKKVPKGELRNAFAEIIKYGVIQDKILFRILEKKLGWFFSSVRKKGLGVRELFFLETVITRSVRVKAHVVAEDERETTGKRMILNYGHTFAHAFEAATRYRIPHGEAVALGMVCAARLARKKRLLRPSEELRQNMLIQEAGFFTHRRGYSLDWRRVLRCMFLDKKRKGGRLRFVLPQAIGRVKITNNISPSEIKDVFSELSRRIKTTG